MIFEDISHLFKLRC